MIRPFFLALGCCLILTSCGGRDEIQEELDRIKAEGSPVTLEDLGLPPGGYESPRWKTILDISEKLAKERKESGFNYQTTAMKPVGAGMAEVVTRRETLSALQDKKPITWVEWDKMLDNTRALMDGVPAPDAGPVYIPDYSRGVATPVPQVHAALSITKAASWLILGDIHDGQIDRALKDISEARQWGKKLTGYSTLLEGIVRLTCDGMLLANSWEILQQPKIAEPQLARLADIWSKGLDPQEILAIWQGERAIMWKTISVYRLSENRKEFYKYQSPPLTSLEYSFLDGWFWGYLYGKIWISQDLAHYLSVFRELEAVVKQWEITKKYLPVRMESQKKDNFIKALPKWKVYRYFLSSFALPSFDEANDKFAATMAQQKLLQTAIALKRYQLAHKTWPDSLNQLVPAYLPSVPLDPIDGQPLRYMKSTHEADGYTLYSIGVNGIDDGGDGTEMKPRENGKPDYRPEKTRDILWPRAAP